MKNEGLSRIEGYQAKERKRTVARRMVTSLIIRMKIPRTDRSNSRRPIIKS
ncbi:MAG: hypothetical protein HGA49_12290 [Eubacteriaceae bacterium]|nr:hypothetical protein [Eubacteriaceae bacterium]